MVGDVNLNDDVKLVFINTMKKRGRKKRRHVKLVFKTKVPAKSRYTLPFSERRQV